MKIFYTKFLDLFVMMHSITYESVPKLLVSWDLFGNQNYRWTYMDKGKVQGC